MPLPSYDELLETSIALPSYDDLLGASEVPSYEELTTTVTPTAAELATLEAPEGSPIAQDVVRARAGDLTQPPGANVVYDPTAARATAIEDVIPKGGDRSIFVRYPGEFGPKEVREVVEGAELETIPRDILLSASPLVGGIEGIHKGYEALRRYFSGEPIERITKEVFPESQELVGIEKKPLEERIKAGANMAIQLAFGKQITGDLIRFKQGGETNAESIRTETQAPGVQTQGLEPGAQGQIRLRGTPENRLATEQPAPSEPVEATIETAPAPIEIQLHISETWNTMTRAQRFNLIGSENKKAARTEPGPFRQMAAKSFEELEPVEQQRVARQFAAGEERLAREYTEGQEEELQTAGAEAGPELEEAIVALGGLPGKGAPAREPWRGELSQIQDLAKQARAPVNKVFRTEAHDVDRLVTGLRDYGFDIDTPQDLFPILEQRYLGGRKIYGNPARTAALSGIEVGRPVPGVSEEPLPLSLPEQLSLEKLRRAKSSLSKSGRAKLAALESRAVAEGQARAGAKAEAAQRTEQMQLLEEEEAGRVAEEPGKRQGSKLIGAPPVPKGQVLVMNNSIPVHLDPIRPGEVAPREIMDALKDVMRVSGSVGEIRRGRFKQKALGIFKSLPEIVRLGSIDDIPTAIHEVGHALAKQFYGTVKSKGMKWLPSAVRRELVGLGKELYGKRKPVAGYTAEGFSEFLRYYMTTDKAGADIAPATYKFFHEGVLRDHPEVAGPLQKARALVDTWRAQGAIGRANAQLVREPGWTRRTLDALLDFFSFQRFAETGEPLRQLSKAAGLARGAKLAPSQDPYKLFKMKRGSAGPILERMVDNNMVDLWGNPTGPSLREALAPVKGRRKEFLLYVWARQAEKRWAEGKNPGITLQDAQYLRATLESTQFDLAASKYLEWNRGLLDYLGQADPTMRPLLDKMKAQGFYAPLARMLDERAAQGHMARSRSNPLYRMHGSGLPVKDIFDQTILNAHRLIDRAHRSLISNAVIRLRNIEGLGDWIEEVPVSKVARQVNIDQIRADLEQFGVDTKSIPEGEILKYYVPADRPKGSGPIIPVRQADGTTRWYEVNPKLYDVVENLEPFSLRSWPFLGTVLDLTVGAMKRGFTLGTTGLRPTFSLITNPLRDIQGWIFQTKASTNPAKMLGAYAQAVGNQIRAAVTGKEGPLAQAAFNLGPQMSQALGRDIGYTKRVSDAIFHGRVIQNVKHPVDLLRQLLNLPESFPRLAELRRRGEELGWKPGDPMTPDQAVELSLAFKEATVDFSASGAISRIMNEAIPFFNPAIQGARTGLRAFRDHPLRTTLLGLALTGYTLARWWENKDKEWYRNLPWRERYYYTHIDDGQGRVFRLPRPFEYGNIFQVLPEAMLDSYYNKDPRAATEGLRHIFDTQNPGTPLDIVPLRLMREQWQNHIDFWDRPIVPRSQVDLQPGAQVGPYTSKLATWLGRAFPDQISPRRVDAALAAAGGGTVHEVLDLIGLGAQKKDREKEFADLPVVGSLARRGGQYSAQSQWLADFWDEKQRADARIGAWPAALANPDQTVVPIREPEVRDLLLSRINGEDIKAAMQIADQIKDSAGRRELYKFAADEAKMYLDLVKKSEK